MWYADSLEEIPELVHARRGWGLLTAENDPYCRGIILVDELLEQSAYMDIYLKAIASHT